MDETTKDPVFNPENLTDEQMQDALKQMMASEHFHGFACCGHSHSHESDDEEAGILWNDAGHRIQIEMAIWVLATVDPGSPFHSLWTFEAFRKGFYCGLWAADYRRPYQNYCSVPLIDRALYTSHFFNPENHSHVGYQNPYIYAIYYETPDVLKPLLFERFTETAYTMVKKEHQEAARLHNQWKANPGSGALTTCGFHLGLAAHYFTDLTQPMHAANFANGIGFEGSWQWPTAEDMRHGKFEDLADDILNNPDSADRPKLLCEPGKAVLHHAANLDALTLETARASKSIFDRKVAGEMRRLQDKWQEPINYAVALSAYEEAFPKGQMATARFLQHWAKANESGELIGKFTSDWVAVSERHDSTTNELHPCMFYRQDVELRVVFRYFDNGRWHEDKETFDRFAGWSSRSFSLFAACYDKGTKHPAVFIADATGNLHYSHAPGGWQHIKITMPQGGRVSGGLVAAYDDRYQKPAAFYRGQNGLLHYVYWKQDGFHVGAVSDQHHVAGAITAVWDPRPAAPDGNGHLTATYVGGDGQLHHWNVRNGNWNHQAIAMPAKGTHADPQMAASVYDVNAGAVGVFWGLLTYQKRKVPESNPELKVREQMPAQLQYTLMKENCPTTALNITAAGGISATTKPNIMVHYCPYETATRFREGAEWIRGQWVRQEFYPGVRVTGQIAAVDSQGPAIVVGARSIYRETVDLQRHTVTPPFAAGDRITLRADNSLLAGRINMGDNNDPIRAVKRQTDPPSTFTVGIPAAGRLTLLADNQKYLGRVFRNSVDAIEAFHGEVNSFSTFEYIFLLFGQIVLVADNGGFVQRFAGRGDTHPLEAHAYQHYRCLLQVRKL